MSSAAVVIGALRVKHEQKISRKYYRIYSVIRQDSPLQINQICLDPSCKFDIVQSKRIQISYPSYKTDLDILIRFGREESLLKLNYTSRIYVYLE